MSALLEFGVAIAKPSNDLIDNAQKIGKARDQLELSNMEDIFRFVTEQVYMDGKSLSETYESEIEEILSDLQEVGTQRSEKSAASYDRFRPTFMRRSFEPTCIEYEVVDYEYVCAEWSQ